MNALNQNQSIVKNDLGHYFICMTICPSQRSKLPVVRAPRTTKKVARQVKIQCSCPTDNHKSVAKTCH